jgi:hypothetical protein
MNITGLTAIKQQKQLLKGDFMIKKALTIVLIIVTLVGMGNMIYQLGVNHERNRAQIEEEYKLDVREGEQK